MLKTRLFFSLWTEPASLNPAELLRKNPKTGEQLYPDQNQSQRQRANIKHHMEQLFTENGLKYQYIVFSDFLASPQCTYTLTNPPKQDRPKTARSVSDRAGTDQDRAAQNPGELSRIKQAAPIGTKSTEENKKSP